jgi:hypothetical protein
MSKFSCAIFISMAVLFNACSIGGPVDWVEKMEQSDRKSSIKGMLSELTAFEEHIELMSKTELSPSFNQVDALLKLDQSIPAEDYDTAYLEDFEAIQSARNHQLEEEDAYIQIKKSNKKAAVPQTLSAARKDTIEMYNKKSATLLPFMNAKLGANRVRYANSLINTFNTGEPCRQESLVDALRKIGTSLYNQDKEGFKKGKLYAAISSVFVKAMKDDIAQPPRTALIAVNTFGQWDAKEKMDTYVEILNRENLDFEYGNALIKVITQFATPENKSQYREKLAPVLRKILMTEPTVQPISYIGLAAKGLANLSVSDEAVIDRLVECLWLDDARGRNATSACRLALNSLDRKTAQKALHKAFKRQNEKIEERAYRLNYGHTGLIEAKSAEILGDLKYNDAVDHLVMSLKTDDVNPEPFANEPTKATFFTKGQVQKTISIARALAMIGDSKAVKPLMSIITNESKLFEYKMAATQQLAYLGSSAPIKSLIKVFNKKLEQLDVGNRDLKVQYGKTIALLMRSKDRNFKTFEKATKKSLDETQSWVKQTEEQIKKATETKVATEKEAETLKTEIKALKDKGVKVPAEPKRGKVDKSLKEKDKEAYKKAREAAYKAHEEAMKKYLENLNKDENKEAKTLRDKEDLLGQKQKAATKLKNLIFEVELGLKIYQSWEKGYKEILTQLATIKSVSNDRQWAKKLSSDKLEERTIAAYVLARKDSKASVTREVFIERLTQEKDPVVRDVILFGLSRHATIEDQAALKAAHKALEKERKEGSTDVTLKGTIYSLELMIAGLHS